MNQFARGAAAPRMHVPVGFRRSPVALAIGLALFGAQCLPAAEATREATAELGEVTVTGSRIRTSVGMETPTPVTAISVNELQTMAPASITEALVQLPQFFNSQTAENFGSAANNFFQSPGGGALNLRGIGTNRTLTLLDGRRMPPASIVGGPDINTFPDELMKRVETVTGGASAAYGTDAVSGVINYILDKDFEGIRGGMQYGQTDRGEGANNKYSIAMGTALGEKAHILLSVSHSKQDPINQIGDRDWYQSCGLILNPAFPAQASATPNSATSQANPRLIPACNLRSTQWSVDGVFNPSPPATGALATLGRVTFDATGLSTPFRRGTLLAADGNTQSGGSGEDFANVLNVLLPESQRTNAFTYFDYDVSDNLNVYAQGMYSEQMLSRAGLVGAYGVSGLHNFTIYQDNAFLPASLRQYMVTNNIASVPFNRQLTPYDGAIGYFNNESKVKVGTLGFTSKLPGGFLEGWNVDNPGTTNLDWAQIGGARQDRVFQAIDAVVDPATGTIKCRVTVVSGLMPDCAPLNLFGRGNASSAAIDWITGFDPGVAVTTQPWIASAGVYGTPVSYVGDEAKHRLVTLNQRVAELTTSGKLFDGWAGPIQAAFGANWRRESVDQRVRASQGNPAADPNWFPVWCNDAGAANGPQCTAAVLNRQVSSGYRRAGNIGVRGVPAGVATNLVETQFSNVPNIRGNYDVKELFNETVVPLLKDLPFLKSLSFQGAVRWADYAGSGQIWSYKGGLDAQLTDELRLRGTYSRDTRAGNISDRFDRTGGVATVTDRKVPGAGQPPVQTTAYTVTIVSGGDPNISPEKGDTFTVGLVYRPEWLPGFDMSVDWLRVQLNDSIESFTAQQIVDQCYQNGDQDQCARITRDTSSGTDVIVFVNQAKQNINKALFNGVDFEVGYSHAVTLLGGGERISARLFGTYLIEASTTNFFGVKTDNTGSVPLQYFKKKANMSLGYSRGGFSWNLNGRYNSGGSTNLTWNQPDANGVTNWNVADNHTGGSVYWDTRMSYRMPVGGGEVELFGNVQNLFDRNPPLVLQQGVGLQTAGGYDQIGRRYVAGVNLKF